MKLIEIFEIKSNPDDKLDRIIVQLSKKGFVIKKINALDIVEMKKHPEILKYLRSKKGLPIITCNGKITTKNELKRLISF